jgi:hypothetical protein
VTAAATSVALELQGADGEEEEKGCQFNLFARSGASPFRIWPGEPERRAYAFVVPIRHIFVPP